MRKERQKLIVYETILTLLRCKSEAVQHQAVVPTRVEAKELKLTGMTGERTKMPQNNLTESPPDGVETGPADEAQTSSNENDAPGETTETIRIAPKIGQALTSAESQDF